MELKFEFARKISKPAKGIPGITLRSISGNCGECSMVIMADNYKDIRAALANYRMLTGCEISSAARGKTLEIKAISLPGDESCAMDHIFDYAKTLKFNTEDALDVCGFYSDVIANSALKPLKIELSAESLEISVTTDIDSAEDENTIYSSLDNVCSEYNVGIIKERPDEL